MAINISQTSRVRIRHVGTSRPKTGRFLIECWRLVRPALARHKSPGKKRPAVSLYANKRKGGGGGATGAAGPWYMGHRVSTEWCMETGVSPAIRPRKKHTTLSVIGSGGRGRGGRSALLFELFDDDWRGLLYICILNTSFIWTENRSSKCLKQKYHTFPHPTLSPKQLSNCFGLLTK